MIPGWDRGKPIFELMPQSALRIVVTLPGLEELTQLEQGQGSREGHWLFVLVA